MQSSPSALHEASGAVRLPTGTATFLFTDIEGSTKRWDRDQAAMLLALRRHDAIVRGAIESAGGHVFKTIGDAFCAVFQKPEDGVAAALAAQHALEAEDFAAVDGVRVRMALHVGTADERDADYFGPTVNRVARLLAIGHGGQVLLSNVAATLATPHLPPDASLRDLGTHRLKDLTTPERVFQLCAPGLTADFPKLTSQGSHEHNLPNQLTDFFGRADDIADIEALLAESRLVTIFGTGGLGKTRCAQQIGRAVLETFDHGVWFVDLAPLIDPALVESEIGTIFKLQQSANRPMLETIVAELKNKRLLLIVDNCEHLVADAARVIDAILRGCAQVRVLATSREALHVPGEVVRYLPPLPVPETSRRLTAEDARGYSGIALFEARARSSHAAFALTDENAPWVADVCRRLDGIPLAIELAAARVKVLGPRQLAAKLDERFRLLTGGSRTALPRQQTMRALIDWSYDLLSSSEARLFRKLAVFVGSFSLESALAACTDEALPEYDVLDVLASLVDKSLVLAEPSGDETRYRLLESMREYAREKLVGQGECTAAAAAHAAAFADLSERLQQAYETVPFRSWYARTGVELENVRAAIAWAFGPDGDVATGQRIAITLRRILVVLAAPEARRWILVALERVDADTPRARVADLELASAHVASILNQHRAAVAAADRALALYTELADARGVANGKRWLGRAMVFLGDVATGEVLLRDSLAAYRALGFRQIGAILRELGTARAAQGDGDGARAFFAEALASFNESGDEANVAVAAGTLAEAEYRCGNVAAALQAAEQALDVAHELGRDFLEAGVLCNLAAYLVRLGRFDEALLRARAAMALAREVESHAFFATAVQHVAAAAAMRPVAASDERRIAAQLLGFVDAELARLELVRDFTEQREYDDLVASLTDHLGVPVLETDRREGERWSLDDVVGMAKRL